MQVYKQLSMDLDLQFQRHGKSAGQMIKGRLDIWGKIRVPFTFKQSFTYALSVISFDSAFVSFHVVQLGPNLS